MTPTFSIIDYCIFAAFLVASASIGVFFAWKGRKQNSNEEFLTGGRKLQMFPVVMSLAASFVSTNTILGVPAEIYTLGTQFSVHLIGFVIAVLLAAKVFVPIFYDLQLTSINKYLKKRFESNALRLAGSLGFLFLTLPYMAVVLYGPSLALGSVTPMSVEQSILIVGVICTFYTSIGGIKAVIWTDVIQCSLMIVGLVMIVAQGSYDLGGLAAPWRLAAAGGRIKFTEFSFDPYRSDTFWAVFLGLTVQWAGAYCVSQTQVQRYNSMKSKKLARKALYWNIPGVLVISALAIWCGVIIYAKYNSCDPISMGIIKRADQLMPYFVMDSMAHIPGAPGFFVACVFSGALSTLSSGFNALAAVTWDDFLKNYCKRISGTRQAFLTKAIAATYGLIAIGLAFVIGRLGTVLQASMALSGSVGGPLFALFCLGLFFPAVNSKGAFFSFVSGIAVCLWMTTGVILYPRPKVQLDVSVNNCSAAIYENYDYEKGVARTHALVSPWEYKPEGMNKLYHISYFYVPLIGFVLTLVIGLLSQCFSGENNPDPSTLTTCARKRLRKSQNTESAKTEAFLKLHPIERS